jgi:O-antigen/teichoic acid export membrane protein
MDADANPAGQRRPLRHLSGSILSVGASRGVSLVAIALTSVALAHIIGRSGIGTYSIGQALLLVFATLAELGMPQAVAYFAGREEWAGRALATNLIGAAFALAVPGCVAMLVGFALFGDSIPGATWPMAIALTAALPFALLWRIGPQAALAQERFEAFALLDASPALLLCPISIAGAAIGDTQGAVIGLGIATIASGASIAAWLLRVPGRGAPPVSPPGGAREVADFGLRAWGSEVLIQLNLRVDLILVGAYAGASESGVYSVALSATAVAWLVMTAISVSALPRSARLGAHSELGLLERTERDDRDARTLRHAVLVAPAVGVAIVALLTIGIPIFYGSAFHRSVALGLILLPGSLALGVGMAAVSILLGRGQGARVLRACLAVVPATVVALLLAVPGGGATAAAIVSSCSYLGFALLTVLELRGASGMTLGQLLVPGRSDLDDYRQLAARTLGGLRGQQ